MFGKMLVATDLSEASERVVCTLGSLKRLGTREALLLHCFNIRDVGTRQPAHDHTIPAGLQPVATSPGESSLRSQL